MPEWSIGAVSKTVDQLAWSQGSNPCLSAEYRRKCLTNKVFAAIYLYLWFGYRLSRLVADNRYFFASLNNNTTFAIMKAMRMKAFRLYNILTIKIHSQIGWCGCNELIGPGRCS